MPVPDEVFPSHSSADRAFTVRLAEVLRDHGIPVWYSDTNIRGAQQWHDEIGAALHRCDWFVVVLTPDAVASKWVKGEFLFYLQKDRFGGRIAPILYRPYSHDELSWTLASLQMIDFRRDFGLGCRDPLRISGIEYVASES